MLPIFPNMERTTAQMTEYPLKHRDYSAIEIQYAGYDQYNIRLKNTAGNLTAKYCYALGGDLWTTANGVVWQRHVNAKPLKKFLSKYGV